MTFDFPADKSDFTAENGVTYTWDTNRWRTKNYKLDDSQLSQYLPLTGGTIDGELHVKKSSNENIFDVTKDSVQYQRHVSSIEQLHPREIINTGILDNLMRDPGKYGYLKDYLPLAGGALTGNLRTNSLIKSTRTSGMAFEVKPNDSDRTGCWDSNGNLTISSSTTTSSTYIFTAKAKAYEIEGIDNPTAFRVLAGGAVKAGHDKEHPFMATAANDVVTKGFADANYLGSGEKKLPGTAVFNYTEERNFISLRPGEISTFTATGEQTSILEDIRQIAFSGVDKDGNRHSPDLHAISTYQSWCSTAHLLNEECSQTFLRIVGGSHLGRDYCVFQYNKDVDIYFLGWEYENTGVLTSEMVRFLPDQKITIRMPDWFL